MGIVQSDGNVSPNLSPQVLNEHCREDIKVPKIGIGWGSGVAVNEQCTRRDICILCCYVLLEFGESILKDELVGVV